MWGLFWVLPEVYGSLNGTKWFVLHIFDRNGDAYEVEAGDYLARAFSAMS